MTNPAFKDIQFFTLYITFIDLIVIPVLLIEHCDSQEDFNQIGYKPRSNL